MYNKFLNPIRIARIERENKKLIKDLQQKISDLEGTVKYYQSENNKAIAWANINKSPINSNTEFAYASVSISIEEIKHHRHGENLIKDIITNTVLKLRRYLADTYDIHLPK